MNNVVKKRTVDFFTELICLKSVFCTKKLFCFPLIRTRRFAECKLPAMFFLLSTFQQRPDFWGAKLILSHLSCLCSSSSVTMVIFAACLSIASLSLQLVKVKTHQQLICREIRGVVDFIRVFQCGGCDLVFGRFGPIGSFYFNFYMMELTGLCQMFLLFNLG